ncbi:MAG TPA: ATP-binding protein [Anaerolineae bacterium]|nr:ATP-binding protein [Anaerolineae bacterium]HPL27232.1 ATP-binding protein [Anaerolineae bacterium]
MGAIVAAFLLLALVWYAFFALVISRERVPHSLQRVLPLGLVALGLGAPALTAGLSLTPLGRHGLELTLTAAGIAMAAHILLHRHLSPLSLARRRNLGYALLTLLAALFYAALAYGVYQAAQVPAAALILAAGLALSGLVLAFPGLSEGLNRWAERALLHSDYAARRMVEEIAVAAPAMLDLEPLAGMILERSLETLAIRWGLFAQWNPATQELHTVAVRGLPSEAKGLRWGGEHPLVGWLLSGQGDAPAAELTMLDVAWLAPFCLSRGGAGPEPPLQAWAVPVRLHDEVLGVFLYGPHTSGRAHSAAERSVLNVLATETAAAVANARLFDQVARARREWLETFDALSDGVFLHDRQGNILRANRALARLAGRPFDQIIGRPWFEIIATAPGLRERCAASARSATAPGALEYDLADEGQRTLHVTVSRLAEGDEFCVHVVRDVTQERALQAQLTQAEKLAAIGEMLSGVAHEINNPLTTIIGFSELLQDADVPDAVRADLKRILRQAKRSSRIVQSLLTFARQSRMQVAEVDVNALLELTLEFLEPQLEGGGIDVVLDLDPCLPRTLADAGQLQQVFLNLLSNAMQAMAAVQGEHTLRLETRTTPTELRIAVHDSGPGIAHELLRRVFDPFFTTKRVGEGTGLGLSICYGIVREHGGRIWAESEPGHGATFFVELPLRHGNAAAPATTPSQT